MDLSFSKAFEEGNIPSNLIKNALKKEILQGIVEPLLDIVGTSVAIYERNGDFAYEFITSEWCKALNTRSRKLCRVKTEKEAMESKKWLCYESCWTECSKRTIQEKNSIDVRCNGGIHLFGVPILLEDIAIGSINIGYGEIARNLEELQEIASTYEISVEKLLAIKAKSSNPIKTLSPLLIQYLETVAKLIGEIVANWVLKENMSLANQKVHSYLDLAGDITVVLNRDATIRHLNTSGLKLLGYSSEELIGKNWLDLCLPARLQTEIKKVFSETIQDNYHPFITYENPIITKSGEERMILWKNSYLETESGQVDASVSVGIDITEFKQMRQDLFESQQKLYTFLEMVPFGVVFVDKGGKITYCNQHALKVFQADKLAVISRNFDDHLWKIEDISGKPFPKENLPFNIVRKTRCPVYDIRHSIFNSTNNTRIYISVNSSPIFDENGKFDGMLASIEDITEKIHHESEKLKNRNLESIGILAGGLAHNLNNILNIISGNLSLIQDFIEESMDLNQINKSNKFILDESFADSLEAIKNAQDLTRQLLTFSKGGAPSIKSIKIRPLLKQSLRMIPECTNISHQIHVESEIITIPLDKKQMLQVLFHILKNAQEAMPNGGKVFLKVQSVTNEHLTQYFLPKKEYILITISDEGFGIEKTELPKIFDPYYTTKTNGTGLGLSIALSIIQRHNGHLKVESQLNQGTTFSIFLPAKIEKKG